MYFGFEIIEVLAFLLINAAMILGLYNASKGEFLLAPVAKKYKSILFSNKFLGIKNINQVEGLEDAFRYKLAEFFYDGIIGCAYCMATFWGIVFFCSMSIHKFGDINNLFTVWLPTVFIYTTILSYVITVFTLFESYIKSCIIKNKG